MYTQCSQCQKNYPITVEELRNSEGIIHCVKCRSTFDPLEFLTEGDVPFDENIDDILPETQEVNPQKSWLWEIGIACCLMLFAIQLYFFEGYNFTQQQGSRKWLEKVCSTLSCRLPDYKNLREFSILYGSLDPVENTGFYKFKTAFTNQSPFVQKMPSIKLILINSTGAILAERVFSPEHFSSLNSEYIQPESSEEIIIQLDAPSKKMAGYRFKLI